MVWEFRPLKEAVRNAHGEVYADNAWEAMQSLENRIQMARFHATEALRIIREAIFAAPGVAESDHESIAAGKAVFLAATLGETGHKLRSAEFRSQAHLVASVQAVHSLCDIVSYAVYWSLKMDSLEKSPAERGVNLHKVMKCLEGQRGYEVTVSRIRDLVGSQEFQYLADYVNTTKHKFLIKSPLSADLDGNRGGLRIKQFTYSPRKGVVREHEQRWAYDFLVKQNDQIVAKIAGIGESLIQCFNCSQ